MSLIIMSEKFLQSQLPSMKSNTCCVNHVRQIPTYQTPVGIPTTHPTQVTHAINAAFANFSAALQLLFILNFRFLILIIIILIAHLSRPWSIGWVALSFLICSFVVQVTLTQYHQILTSPAFCWPSIISYHVSTSSASYWPSIIIYQAALSYTDQVPPSTNQCQNIQMSDFPLSTWDEHICTLV